MAKKDAPAVSSDTGKAPVEADRNIGVEMDPTDSMRDTCGMDAFSEWLGKQAADMPDGLLKTTDRILSPDAMATMDYVPERLNVLTDDRGMIIGFKCG